VAAGWQPKLSVPMIDEQNVVAVRADEIRDEVLRRCRRLLDATELGAGVDPAQSVSPMFVLETIESADRGDFITDLRT